MRRALKQAWELDDADKAERPIRNLARRFEAYKQLPILKQALIEQRQKHLLDQIKDAA